MTKTTRNQSQELIMPRHTQPSIPTSTEIENSFLFQPGKSETVPSMGPHTATIRVAMEVA